ncbi:unnamed protein product [Gongylonema pulchrum]|uniref:G_PROTEIN_RECEP_F1_2 domain-containing protein n=1 Tax=Gongylonema pulchrum TaxID=637853 RepID=A0A183D0E9_9BILA|nr:unnamed protein product [Gongylonema pulchrum]
MFMFTLRIFVTPVGFIYRYALICGKHRLVRLYDQRRYVIGVCLLLMIIPMAMSIANRIMSSINERALLNPMLQLLDNVLIIVVYKDISSSIIMNVASAVFFVELCNCLFHLLVSLVEIHPNLAENKMSHNVFLTCSELPRFVPSNVGVRCDKPRVHHFNDNFIQYHFHNIPLYTQNVARKCHGSKNENASTTAHHRYAIPGSDTADLFNSATYCLPKRELRRCGCGRLRIVGDDVYKLAALFEFNLLTLLCQTISNWVFSLVSAICCIHFWSAACNGYKA